MRLVVTIIMAGLMLAGCGTAITAKDRVVMPEKIQTWETFAWKNDPLSVKDKNYNQANQSIRQAVNEKMTALGYRQVERGQADFLLSHSIFAHFEREKLSEREQRALMEEEMMNPGSHLGEGSIAHEQGEGFLYLAATGQDGKVAWDGRVESVLNYRGQGAKVITTAVNKLLSDFPAKTN